MSVVPERAPWSKAFDPLRRRLQPVTKWAMANWPGRILLRTVAAVVRVELLDRAMTLAAQLFTSVFPLFIMAAVMFGKRYDNQIADAVGLPEGTRQVLDEALAGGGFSAFGVLGAVIVLISSTSLARTMIRGYGTIWRLPRPRRSMRSAWRLPAAVLLLVVLVVLERLLVWLTGRFPVPPLTTPVLTFLAGTALAVALPWILLAGALPTRLLLPGGIVFGLTMLAVRPVGSIYLPHALEVSADRYGTIGLAFTYIGWLYILSLCYLAAAIVGQVLAQDEGRLGQLIRGRAALPAPDQPDRHD
ncbi:MAG TPA: YhjD/YihY/BrkB family envelope integrity protein [Actinophytocola sp.]|uniref:YhjD/YihY/BrkB family envelope integrity protein n=1 Tax=Actinophytocola sp. TaxID=1872138 RepID=UPI002DB92FBF|nr:YhjD/YihY/BrkB family envelope integrity protein [Actinophytocola sp.]HEU5471007.1 YhjD/YihY/BrkB family envelope integrity protein [Actinophytocola sp.]